MKNRISKRLEAIVNALPLKEDLRILEIGCGTGVLARELARRFNRIYILGLDRSAKAIEQSIAGSGVEMENGKLHFKQVAVEDFEWNGDELFDLAIAIRVGALDGRHPKIERKALAHIARALKPDSKLYIDGGDPLKEIDIKEYR